MVVVMSILKGLQVTSGFNMTLDECIYRDIEERLVGKEISAAVELGAIIKPQASAAHHFSTKGLPSYYFGNREARTVMVNLNPGEDAGICDSNWSEATGKFDHSSVAGFVRNYHERQANYGTNYGLKANGDADEFDVKQAAFLTPWENNGIGLSSSPNWEDRDFCIDAKRKVINNKLQLELIPYASAKFDINTKHFGLLVPFINTLINEIFAKDRAYVVFASAIFEKIFKQYNKAFPNTFVLSETSIMEAPLKDGGQLKGKCRIVTINHKGKTQKALIAHTFPSQALCRAFKLMQKYGEFCYSIWKQKI